MKNAVVVLLAIIAFDSLSFADVLIIANKDVPEMTLSQKEVRDIFLGKSVQWSDNSRIRPFILGDPRVHSIFLKQYVRFSDADWKIYWKRMVFTGRGMPPETIPTQAELIRFVSEKQGAVGYVSSGVNAENDGVKIIREK